MSDPERPENTESAPQAADTPPDEVEAPGPVAESKAARDEPPPSAAPRVRSGRGWAVLALLVALGAAGASGYLYYRALYQNPLAAFEGELAALGDARRADLAQLRGVLDDNVAGLRGDLDDQRNALKQSEEALAQSINEGLRMTPPSSREWKLAEVEYLLRIANHRLLMERDARAAAQLLGAADEILAELDDYSLYPVRAQLAEERLALANVDEIDVQGAFLRIEAIKSELDQLPLHLPEFLSERRSEAEPVAEQSLWQALLARIGSFVEFRRYPEGGVRPLLSPDEAGYLEMNLRLMLERSQLALLRRDALLYQHSIAAALSWLDAYLDADSRTVIEVRGELQSLETLKLDRELPDISGSLANLRSLARYGIEDEAAP